jgi:hypothetical protein
VDFHNNISDVLSLYAQALAQQAHASASGNAAMISAIQAQVSAPGGGYSFGSPPNALNPVYAGGADPAGVADSTAAIQAALNATSAGQPTVLPVGTFLISSPITMFSGDELMGSHGSKHVLTGTILKLSASFAGAAAIILAPSSSEQRVTRVNIDGSLATANTVIGIKADTSTGPVQYVQLSDILITGAGISTGVSAQSTGANLPNGWRCERVVVLNNGGTGILLANAADGHWTNCQTIGAGNFGWSINGCTNSLFTACRADFAVNDGWAVTGSWSTGAGSGGCQWIGCSTDRNGHSGVNITATGSVPMFFDGIMCRRDGSSSVSGGFAGLRLNGATVPVTVDGITVWPGPADDGSGNVTPQYGISVIGSSAYLQVASGYVQGVSSSVNNDATNTYVGISLDTIRASGPNTAAVFDGQATSKANISEVDVASTGTETDLVTLTLPTGYLKAGTAFRIDLSGTAQFISTSGTLTFRAYLGGVVSTETVQMASQGSAGGPSGFWLTMLVTVRAADVSGTFVSTGRGEIESATRVNLSQGNVLTTATVNTTQASPVVKVSAQWQTADPSNALKVSVATIEPAGRVLT